MRYVLPFLFILVAFLLLTVLSQVGGILLLISLPLASRLFRRHSYRLPKIACFALFFHLAVITLLIPPLASYGNRVALPWFATDTTPLRPVSLLYPLLCRNYARPDARAMLEDAARTVQKAHPGSELVYFDACLPFLDGFPLLPHLSHDDGRKVDLAFFYQDAEDGRPKTSPPSPIGYWAYEQPILGEYQPCVDTTSYLRWDFDWLQPVFSGTEIDLQRTRSLMAALLADKRVQKIFIEPHLKTRLGLSDARIRFQGCRAARHDDHLHVQVH